jgi:hypothetical protein
MDTDLASETSSDYHTMGEVQKFSNCACNMPPAQYFTIGELVNLRVHLYGDSCRKCGSSVYSHGMQTRYSESDLPGRKQEKIRMNQLVKQPAVETVATT